MTRASRFVSYAGVLSTAYTLVWLQILHIPFVDASITEQLLPVVRICLLRGMHTVPLLSRSLMS